MGLRETGWCGMDWIDLAEDRGQWKALESTVMALTVPLNPEIFLRSCTTDGLSRKAQLRGISYAFLHHHTDASTPTDRKVPFGLETNAEPLAAVRSNQGFTLILRASFARLRFSGGNGCGQLL
jgi:hypothetical protein